MTIGIIGIGNMGAAILNSIINSKICSLGDIYIYDKISQATTPFENNGVNICKTDAEAANTDYLILAVKPQNMEETVVNIKNNLNRQTVIISIAAGINENLFANVLGYIPKLALVMPNTPLVLGEGATALSRAGNIEDDEFEFVKAIFSTRGTAVEIDKSQMNEIIAINGSSPAFIYLFAKGFMQYAKSVELDEQKTLELFCASLKGAAKMMTEYGKDIDSLINMVTSPGGTTLAGLKVLENENFTDIIKKTCEATTQRARELNL